MNLNNFLPYQLSVLSNKISSGIAKFYKEKYGINVPEWRVLVLLSATNHQTAKDLAIHTHMDKVKVSRTMKLLASKKLISEKTCKDDARARRYTLTNKGKKLINAVKPMALGYEEDLLQGLDKSEITTLQTCIVKLNQRLDKIKAKKP